jgi:hypothetical protein
MKEWKVTIECNHKKIEKLLSAVSYSEAYIIVLTEHPDCIIVSISEVRS